MSNFDTFCVKNLTHAFNSVLVKLIPNINFKNPTLLVKNGSTSASPPIKITLNNEESKFKLLKAAKQLREINKRTKINISQDLNEIDRVMNKKLVQEKKQLNNQLPSNCDYYYGIRGTKVIKITKRIIFNEIKNFHQLSNINFNFCNNKTCTFNNPSLYSTGSYESFNTAFSTLKLNNFKICSFNTNGAKGNLNFLQLLVNQNDFIFFCETWLLDYESEKYLNFLSSTHDFLHKSDMNIAPLKGRPYGGRTFIIKKHINIKNYNFINKHLAFITLELNKKKFSFISVYLPFDNNTT